MIHEIHHDDKLIALIVKREFKGGGVNFFTPHSFSQQLAVLTHPAGKEIQPHVHKIQPREVLYTQEVLFIRQGKLRVDLYSKEQEFLESHVLEEGDIILLADGGHGFEVLQDVEMFEVKQGPYNPEDDKIRFAGQAPALTCK